MELDKLNVLRKKYIRCNVICYSIAIIINVALLLIYRKNIISFTFNFYFVIPFILIFSLVIAGIPGQKYLKEYISIYKNYFVYNALKEVFNSLTYNPEEGILKEELDMTNMIDTSDLYDSNDLIKGSYKDVSFVSSDVSIEEEHEKYDEDGNKQVYYETLFMGRWFIFEFNKSFKSNLCVTQNTSVIKIYNNFEKIQMEDEQFNKKFLIYAQNEHEAFYILTPLFMQKLKDISLKINGRLILCFDNNKLYLGLDNFLDSFEPNISKKVNEKIIKEDIKKDISVITDFIDYLDLDNDLFRKD